MIIRFYIKLNLLVLSIIFMLAQTSISAQNFIRTYFDTIRFSGSFFSELKVNHLTDEIVTTSPFLGPQVILHKLNKNGDTLNISSLNNIFWDGGMIIRNDSIFTVGSSRNSNDSLYFIYTLLNTDFKILLQQEYSMPRYNKSHLNSFKILFANENQIIIHCANRDPNIINPGLTDNRQTKYWTRLTLDGRVISRDNLYRYASGSVGEYNDTYLTPDIDGNPVFVVTQHPKVHLCKIYPNDSVAVVFKDIVFPNFWGPEYRLKLFLDPHGNYIMLLNDDYLPFDVSYHGFPKVVKLDRQGKKIWERMPPPLTRVFDGRDKPVTGTYQNSDSFQSKDGDILFTGSCHIVDSFPKLKDKSQMMLPRFGQGNFLARYADDGTLLWRHWMVARMENDEIREFYTSHLGELSDGSLIIAGQIAYPDTNRIFGGPHLPFIMKLGANGCFDPQCSHVDRWWYFPDEFPVSVVETDIGSLPITLFPNPASQMITFAQDDNFESPLYYQVSDINGRKHEIGVFDDSKSSYSLDISYLPSAIYFLTIKDKHGKKVTKKFVKE